MTALSLEERIAQATRRQDASDGDLMCWAQRYPDRYAKFFREENAYGPRWRGIWLRGVNITAAPKG
jgi:hypothetical protein